jgi:hypothetical protein
MCGWFSGWCLLLLVGASGCFDIGSDAPPDPDKGPAESVELISGISGTSMEHYLGGKDPNARTKVRPYSKLAIVLKELHADKVLYRVTPDKKGKFRIVAKPGQYRVAVEMRDPPQRLLGLRLVWSGLGGGGEKVVYNEWNPERPDRALEIEIVPGKFAEVKVEVETIS